MKIKRILSIVLILSVVTGIFSFGGISASAMDFIDNIYLKPEQIAIDMANTTPGSYFEVTAHTENGIYPTRMTNVSSGLYKATISQTVIHFEFALKDINDAELWHAIAAYDSSDFNCVSFEGGINFPVWEQYGSSDSNIGTTPEPTGDGTIYFTPNEEWKNDTSRFAVRIVIDGKAEYEELTPVEGDVYCFAEREGASSYSFCALSLTATAPNQFLYVAKATTRPTSIVVNHYVLNDGKTSQAEGRWTVREVAGSEEPVIPPTVEIEPGPDDEVFWGYSENEPAGSAKLSDVLTTVYGDTCYITMLKPVTLSDTIVISTDKYVLDLAGYTIESNAQVSFILNDNASLTVKDTAENGTIIARSELDSVLFNIQNAKLIIEGGIFKSEGIGIITQAGASSQTTINGGSLYAGSVSAITIHEGKLNVYGGGFYNGCTEAHISYRAATYNRNITITGLDTNSNTTLAIYEVQNPVSINGIGSSERLIASTSPGGTSCSVLYPDTVYYIDINHILYFTEGHATDFVREGQNYIIPQYEGSYPFGKEFEGWKDISTNEIYHVGMNFIPTKDMKFTPVWIDGVIISVSFNANGGTGSMSPTDATAKAPFSLPYCLFTAPEGKVFDKWQVNGATYNVNETVVLENDTEVLALWKDGVRVVFKANGGVGEDIVTYVESGEKFVFPKNTFTAPDGKNFKNWLVNGTEYAPGSSTYITSETEILALWKDGFSVTYKPNGGTGSVRVENYLEETTIVLSENFFTAPKNKFFKCWEVNGEEKMPSELITVSEETTILAVWGNVFSVKYLFTVRPFNGEASYTKTRTDTANDVEGYTFKHPTELFTDGLTTQLEAYYWEDENGRQYMIDETTTINGDLTLTLNYKWRLTVSVDPDNDVDNWQYHELLEGDKFVLPDAPENGIAGYVFDGWKNMKTGNISKPGDETTVMQNITFRAQWKKCADHSFKDGICEHCGILEKYTITAYMAESKTAYISAPEEGTYTLVFADYEGGKLANMEYSTVSFTEDTKGTILTASITKDFSLSKGDKIMLWSGITKLVPLCDEYIVK